jgi:hypothetical protein
MIGFLTERRVGIIRFAPHTIQIFQVFDVTLFAVLKWHARCDLPFGDEEVTDKFLMKAYSEFKQRTVDFNIRRAFQ